MIESEGYRPQQAEEEINGKSTQPAAETAHAPEAKEAALNPRIRALREARDEAERKLQEAILDVETREQSIEFQRAKEIFDAGKRLKYSEMYDMPRLVYGPKTAVEDYGFTDHDTESNYEFSFESDSVFDESDAFSHLEEESLSLLYDAMDIPASVDKKAVVRHLFNLTREEN